MHKLFKMDMGLVLLTITGSLYLYLTHQIGFTYTLFIVFFYISAKIISYKLLSYEQFDIFIRNLTKKSKLFFFSGFEVFKTSLVTLLFLGFLFIDPRIWIIESILVVMMRIWGLAFIKNN